MNTPRVLTLFQSRRSGKYPLPVIVTSATPILPQTMAVLRALATKGKL